MHALTITIDQSRRINIFPRTQAEEVLNRMEVGKWEKAIATCEKMIAGKTALDWEAQESWVQAHLHLVKAYKEADDDLTKKF